MVNLLMGGFIEFLLTSEQNNVSFYLFVCFLLGEKGMRNVRYLRTSLDSIFASLIWCNISKFFSMSRQASLLML